MGRRWALSHLGCYAQRSAQSKHCKSEWVIHSQTSPGLKKKLPRPPGSWLGMRANTSAAAGFVEQKQAHLPHELWESPPSPSPGENPLLGTESPRAPSLEHRICAYLGCT